MGDHLKTLVSSFHVWFTSNRKSFLPCQLQQERGLCLDQAAVWKRRNITGNFKQIGWRIFNCYNHFCSLGNESSFCTLCSVNFSDVGTFLGEMCDIKELFSIQPRYPNLSKLALACVVLPNSNADSERIFSMLKKIQTEHRSKLTNDTICSLICAKQNQNMECYEYWPEYWYWKRQKQLV
jgi:hypothetical protein